MRHSDVPDSTEGCSTCLRVDIFSYCTDCATVLDSEIYRGTSTHELAYLIVLLLLSNGKILLSFFSRGIGFQFVENSMAQNCVVIDNGGGTIKFGFASDTDPKSIRNSIGTFKNQPRRYIADDIDGLRNTSGLLITRPCEKGVITNWQCLMDVWNRAFTLMALQNTKLDDKALILTSTPFAPESVMNDTNELVFEEMGFGSYLTRPPSWFSAYEHMLTMKSSLGAAGSSCSLVIDSGFSYTHAIPFVDMKTRARAVPSNTLIYPFHVQLFILYHSVVDSMLEGRC